MIHGLISWMVLMAPFRRLARRSFIDLLNRRINFNSKRHKIDLEKVFFIFYILVRFRPTTDSIVRLCLSFSRAREK